MAADLVERLSPERMALLTRDLEAVESAGILRWKADLEWCEVKALLSEIAELRQRERGLRAVPKASPRKAISADYATGYNHALETVLAILDKAPTETKDSK